MSVAALVAIELLTFHMVDGRTVLINPQQVTQIIHPKEEGHDVLVDSVKCVIRLTDGTFISVAESCEEVQRVMEENGGHAQ